jgi:hypothetical protein
MEHAGVIEQRTLSYLHMSQEYSHVIKLRSGGKVRKCL